MTRVKSYPTLALSIEAAAARLTTLPSSVRVTALRTVLSELRDEVAEWDRVPPLSEEHQQMVRQVLAIHLVFMQIRVRRR